MSEILKLCGIAVLAVILGAILKHQGSQSAKYVPETAALLILITVILSLGPMIDMLKNTFYSISFSIDLLQVLLKTAAIAIICQFTSDICKEHGENMLSGAVEFAGNASIIVMSVPIIKNLLTEVFSLLK